MNQISDKRKHTRKPYVEEITAHINSNEFDESLLSKTILCETLDISEAGIQLKTADQLTVGLELELWIKIENRPGKFLLAGDITWVNILDKPTSYFVGVALKNKPHTGFLQWKALFN